MAPRVGVVGLGQMGQGIARNLVAAGLAGTVTDARPGCAEGFPGHWAASVAEVVAAGEITLFVVPTTADIAAALEGVDMAPGHLVVDLTTSEPGAGRALAARLAERGAAYVDAAMSGGGAGAEAGTLTLMAGGAAEDMARLAPVFDVIAGKVFHLGPVGSGQTMKLVHNMILHTTFLATCEGLWLARAAGLDPAAAVEVLNAGNARSYVSEVRFPRDILSGAMTCRSEVRNLAKDLAMADVLARDLGAANPYGAMTAALLARAAGEMGLAESDFSHLFPEFPRIVGEG
ncbi:NAD(P)-dependent oxidoreductase [Histidinibacterium lentulum]|uniref:NAD(P)-dependent oxidoreductase n=1 Tax=Histidinibacterium lentulum TaxID=2480588 RepID=A0A3N2QRF6_9RHOB|nr:NAD(P)-dependent oxidoreductase [Histidinibacterium lentulum]ROT97798.1 NAD(P)-dependent oxidoreductase [Histidinibacterium lentulum]